MLLEYSFIHTTNEHKNDKIQEEFGWRVMPIAQGSEEKKEIKHFFPKIISACVYTKIQFQVQHYIISCETQRKVKFKRFNFS